MDRFLVSGAKLRVLPKLGVVVCCGLGFACLASAQKITKVAIAPASVVGGSAATGTVTISPKAGTEGASIGLSSNCAAAMVSQTMTITKGKTSGTFPITTTPVAADTAAKITATLGSSNASASTTIKAPTLTSFALTPTSVAGGNTVTGAVKISSAAPSNGLMIHVTSNQSAVTAPEGITIPAGAKAASGTIKTSAVATKTIAKVTASLGKSSIGVPLTVNPPTLSSLTVNPSSVGGGSTATGKVTITGPAPSGRLFGVLEQHRFSEVLEWCRAVSAV